MFLKKNSRKYEKYAFFWFKSEETGDFYIKYGYYRDIGSYISEWNAHNFVYTLWPWGEIGERARSVNLNYNLEDDKFHKIYPLF